MALEATTGWRFVVEELQRIGGDVHLAEPAETSALKGKKQRAKTDWADARHQRELLLIGRLPRWALYEAAQQARFPASPDRAYYLQAAERIGGNRACLALARKLLKRSYHILKELGEPALEPVAT